MNHIPATKSLSDTSGKPIKITAEGLILSGVAERDGAIRRDAQLVSCLVYELNEAHAVEFLIQRRHQHERYNDFCRVYLALEWCKDLRQQGRCNQQLGGKHKGSTKLSDDRRIDVRRAIAAKTNVSEGNVYKVQEILIRGIPRLIEALKTDEITINMAFSFLGDPLQQRKRLTAYLSAREMGGLNRQIRQIVRRAVSKPPSQKDCSPEGVRRALLNMKQGELDAIGTYLIKNNRPYIAVSTPVLQMAQTAIGGEHGED